MFQGKSNTFTSDLLRNPIFLFGLMCLAFLGLKKLAGALRFGSIGSIVQTYSYEMVRGKDANRILTVDDYPTVVRENTWTPPNRNPMSGDIVKKTVDGFAAPGQAGTTGKKAGIAAAPAARAQAKRKPKVEVNVIGDDPVKSLGEESGSLHNDVVFHGPAPAVVVAAPAQSAANEEAKEEEKKLTLNDWRALLSTLNRQNLDKLLSARKSGSITTADFYTLVKELVTSHVEEKQNAGIYALSSEVSASAFEFVVVNKAATAQNVQTKMNAILKKYEEPAQAGALAQVLMASKRPEVVSEAMKSLNVAVTALKNQVSAQGEGRNPAVAAQAQRSLIALLPSLRRMSAVGDETSGMAADLISQIESLTVKTV